MALLPLHADPALPLTHVSCVEPLHAARASGSASGSDPPGWTGLLSERAYILDLAPKVGAAAPGEHHRALLAAPQ